LNLARLAYVAQNPGKKHIAFGFAETSWYTLLPQTFPDVQDVMYCPEAPEGTGFIDGHESSAYTGNAFHAWAQLLPWQGTFLGGSSYGLNGWLRVLPPGVVPFRGAPRDAFITEPTTSVDRVPVFADCAISFAFPETTDPPPRNLVTPITMRGNLTKPEYGLQPFCMARHGRAINIVFLDGHAATSPLEELWELRWNALWVPTKVTLPPQ
jgi:prepilin-type processing-associated H-X9-DG protein